MLSKQKVSKNHLRLNLVVSIVILVLSCLPLYLSWYKTEGNKVTILHFCIGSARKIRVLLTVFCVYKTNRRLKRIIMDVSSRLYPLRLPMGSWRLLFLLMAFNCVSRSKKFPLTSQFFGAKILQIGF